MPRTIEELREIEEQMERVAHHLRHEEIESMYCDECEMTTPHRQAWRAFVQNGVMMNVRDGWECAVCWYVRQYLPAMED